MYEKGGALTHRRLPENIDTPARRDLKLPDPRKLRSGGAAPSAGVGINSFFSGTGGFSAVRDFPANLMRPPVIRPGGTLTFTNRDALQSRPQYQWGVRTGKLFTALASVQCSGDASHYCDNKVDELETYYQWETGPNQWNQFAAVKDAQGAIVAFDAPLQVTYGVPTGAQYGAYAGKSIVLQYGGFGELWGIPGTCVSRLTNEKVSCETPDSRYVPAFVIPFDEVLGRVNNGATPLLAKWLDREIRFAKKDVAVCSAAGLTVPSGLTLPSASDLKDPSDSSSAIFIGTKPVVTDAPRVIHGDVKF